MARPASLLLLILIGCTSAPPRLEPEQAYAEILRKYAEDNDPLAAVAGLHEVLRERPDWPEAHLARATILLAAGRKSGALASFDRALSLRPKYLDALTSRGMLLAELG